MSGRGWVLLRGAGANQSAGGQRERHGRCKVRHRVLPPESGQSSTFSDWTGPGGRPGPFGETIGHMPIPIVAIGLRNTAAGLGRGENSVHLVGVFADSPPLRGVKRMPFSWRVALVTVVGLCVTTFLPIAAAIEIGRRQALEVENRFVLGQAQAALLRSELTGMQLVRARDAMQDFDRAAACSDSGLDLMRELDLSSTMLQGVGFVENERIVCSSFGGRRDYALGPAYYTSANGSIFRRNVRLGTSGEPYVVVQTGASAGVVHKDLALSFVEDVPGSAISVFSWSRRLPVLQRGTVPRSFITRNYERDTIFRTGGSTVAVVKSAGFDLGAIAIVPSANAAEFTRQAIMVMVPVGLAGA